MGIRPDWIEIYNPNPFSINLSGWHLTDDAFTLTKWTFPDTLLKPREYFVVFASDKDRAVAGSETAYKF